MNLNRMIGAEARIRLACFPFFYFFPSEIPVLGKKLGYETALEARQTFSNALRLNGDAFPPPPIYKRVARVLVRARKHLWAGTRISPYIFTLRGDQSVS